MQDFDNKVAVVTGAASGIGRGMARGWAEEGMTVGIADMNEPGLASLAAELEELGATVASQIVDVSSAEAVEQLAEFAYQRFGKVNLLFNNAGVLLAGNSWERSIEDWQWILGVNLFGVIHGVKSFVPRMLEQGEPAHIINTSSIAGLLAAPLMGLYSVGKQAVVALSETLHYELQATGAPVAVSVLCPGPIDTGIAGSGAQREPGVRSEAQDMLMGFLTSGISEGMSPEECAGIVFDAIREQRFWIFTHQDFKPAWQRRAETVMDNLNPVYEVYVTEE
jgi:NAD(P)-dependent dehydrogenase (short-subunit alcohol dehydrogenase family)